LLKKAEKDKTIQMILNICSNIGNAENTGEHQKLYSKYFHLQNQKFSRKEKDEQKDILKEMFSAAFGFDMDDDIDPDDPAKLGEKLNQRFTEEMHQRQNERFSGEKHKSYSGVNKKLSEKAALLQKSWKALYLKLVKKFHPDTESDEEKRLHKTDIMQQVTKAYEKNNLYTLLSIYQQEVKFNIGEGAADDHLFTDTALYQFIIILKKQDADLKDKIGVIEFEAANCGMPYLANKDAEKFLLSSIKREKAEMRTNIVAIDEDVRRFRNIDEYKRHLKLINFDSFDHIDAEDDLSWF
jgi:hypothetical protein